MNATEHEADQYFRKNKWGVRITKRGTDYDVAEIVLRLGFPDEVVLARAMWLNDAMTVVNEHNESLARRLFPQKPVCENPHPLLKPCPFCKGLSFIWYYEGMNHQYINHNKGCPIEHHRKIEPKDWESWNVRAAN